MLSMPMPAWVGLLGVGVALLGVSVALGGILWIRHTAKQRETLQFMHDYNNDPMVVEGFDVIYQVKAGDLSVEDAMDRQENGGKSRVAFLHLASKFEILAIGLNNGIYNKKMITDCFGRDISEIFLVSKDLIDHVRNQDKTEWGIKSDSAALREFEKLALEVEPKP